MKLKFACIGDIHGFWEESDAEYFNQSDYDFLLLTGDLPDHKPLSIGRQELYRKLNLLRIPTHMCLGNWDGANYLQLIGEVFQIGWMIRLGGIGHLKRVEKIKKSLSNLKIGSYSIQSLAKNKINSNKDISQNEQINSGSSKKSENEGIGLLIGRPFTCGGSNLAFRPSLKKQFGISSMEDSTNYYKNLIDPLAHQYSSLIILSHNGPTGLGDKATSIYGCDFRREEGDWGDPDLEGAISYAKSVGIKIPLVVSGHMHHRNPKTKSEREWLVQKEGTTYLNAAKVPRNASYYSVELNGSGASVKLNYIDRSI